MRGNSTRASCPVGGTPNLRKTSAGVHRGSGSWNRPVVKMRRPAEALCGGVQAGIGTNRNPSELKFNTIQYNPSVFLSTAQLTDARTRETPDRRRRGKDTRHERTNRPTRATRRSHPPHHTSHQSRVCNSLEHGTTQTRTVLCGFMRVGCDATSGFSTW